MFEDTPKSRTEQEIKAPTRCGRYQRFAMDDMVANGPALSLLLRSVGLELAKESARLSDTEED